MVLRFSVNQDILLSSSISSKYGHFVPKKPRRRLAIPRPSQVKQSQRWWVERERQTRAALILSCYLTYRGPLDLTWPDLTVSLTVTAVSEVAAEMRESGLMGGLSRFEMVMCISFVMIPPSHLNYEFCIQATKKTAIVPILQECSIVKKAKANDMFACCEGCS